MNFNLLRTNVRLCAIAPALAALSACPLLVHAESVVSIPMTVVTGSRYELPLEKVLTDVSVITREDIAASQAASVADLLRDQPGFEFGRNGGPGSTTSFFLRGGASTNVVVLIDGVRTPVDGIGALFAVNTPLSSIDRIEIMRGNAGALYGDGATSGVIQIFTRDPESAQVEATVGHGERGAYDASFTFSDQFEATSYAMTAGVTRSSAVSAMNTAINTLANPDLDPSEDQYVSAGVAYTDRLVGRLKANVRIGEGETAYDANTSSTATHLQLRSNSDIELSWARPLTPDLEGELFISRSIQVTNDKLNGASAQAAYANGEASARQSTFRGTAAWTFDAGNKAMLGTEVVKAHYVADATSNGYNGNRNLLAVFGGVTRDIDVYTVQANARRERAQVDDSVKVVDRRWTTNSWLLGAGRPLGDGWRASVNVSKGHRAPTVYDISNNSTLAPEVHLSKEGGLTYTDTTKQMRFIWFHTRSDNAVVTYLASPYNQVAQHLRVTGVEWSGDWQIGKVTRVNWALTAQDPKNTDTWTQAARRAQTFGSFGITNRFKGNDLGVNVHMSGPRNNSDFDSVRLDSYTTVDLSLSRKLSQGWTMRARLENAEDRDYQLANGYNTVGRNVSVLFSYSPK